jgi:CheY-like chemotaxis protein
MDQASLGRKEFAGSRRVLIVDDDADAADLLHGLVEHDGHHSRVVYCARDALAAARELRPHVALIDIGLPDMNGYDLTRSLRALPELRGCRFIAVTGHSRPSAIARGIAAGFESYLTKPISALDVLTLIKAGTGS